MYQSSNKFLDIFYLIIAAGSQRSELGFKNWFGEWIIMLKNFMLFLLCVAIFVVYLKMNRIAEAIIICLFRRNITWIKNMVVGDSGTAIIYPNREFEDKDRLY